MRKLLTVIVYTLVILLIGRNLTFLPRFQVLSNPDTYAKDLEHQTKEIIEKKKGSYGISYYDLTSKKGFGINQDEMFTAASINKLPIIATLYYLENKGKIDFDEQITLTENDIQDYGTGSLRYAKLGTTYSLKTLAKLSLKQSDNTAAHILASKIGVPMIQDTIEHFGLTQTDINNNQTSPSDMTLLLQKIWDNQITTKAKTKELLGFMRQTDIEDRIPAKLPSSSIVYHKTGDAVGSLHDVGIIKEGDTVFILSILTSDIGKDESVTKQAISEISKVIVTFYEKRR